MKFKYFIFLSLIGILAFSVIKSGYYYQYDNDEILHTQMVFLLNKGYTPYVDFFSIHSPIYHIFLMPIFSFFGFTFQAINMARILMIFLFFLRFGLIFLLIRIVFGTKVGAIFIPLYLLDPLTVFSNMQIRPDNFMMTFYILSLLTFTTAIIKKSNKILVLSGFFLGLTFLVQIKILPSLITLLVIYFIYSMRKGKAFNFWILTSSFFLPILIFFIFYLLQGSFFPMFQQLFIDPFADNASHQPLSFGFFHQPYNVYIWGIWGKPVIWYYAYFLLFLPFTGVYITFLEFVKKKSYDGKDLIKIILIVSFIVHLLTLMFINAAYTQYYLPFSWLVSVFTAIFINQFLFILPLGKKFQAVAKAIVIVLFIIIGISAFKTNLERSKMGSDGFINSMKMAWSIVPNNSPTFPNILFRPLGYPIPYGYDLPYIAKAFPSRFPKLTSTLEKNKVQFIYIDNPALLSILDPDIEEYVKANYHQIENTKNVWKRIN